jgi:hypothetical protein
MILPRYSYLLAGLLPDAQLKIYPDSAHGFLSQHRSRFAADVGDSRGSWLIPTWEVGKVLIALGNS